MKRLAKLTVLAVAVMLLIPGLASATLFDTYGNQIQGFDETTTFTAVPDLPATPTLDVWYREDLIMGASAVNPGAVGARLYSMTSWNTSANKYQYDLYLEVLSPFAADVEFLELVVHEDVSGSFISASDPSNPMLVTATATYTPGTIIPPMINTPPKLTINFTDAIPYNTDDSDGFGAFGPKITYLSDLSPTKEAAIAKDGAGTASGSTSGAGGSADGGPGTVPEPGSLLLIGSGLLGLAVFARRRRAA